MRRNRRSSSSSEHSIPTKCPCTCDRARTCRCLPLLPRPTTTPIASGHGLSLLPPLRCTALHFAAQVPRCPPSRHPTPHPAAGDSQGSTNPWGRLPSKSPMQDRDFEQLANAGLSVFDLNSEYLAQKDW